MEISRVSMTVAFAILLLSGCSKSYRNVGSYYSNNNYVEQNYGIGNYTPNENDTLPEAALTYAKRLSYAFGADSTCAGIDEHNMNLPDWYCDCYFNNKGRLSINIVGDTLKYRPILEEMLQGSDFDLGIGICSKKEQLRVDSLLFNAIQSKYFGNFSTIGNVDGSIDVYLQGDNDSIIQQFKNDVFDHPILRFKVAMDVGVVDVEKVPIEVEERMFVEHETTPQFPGGDSAMQSYIYDNLNYPQSAYDKNIEGRVVLKFLVRKTGEVDSVKILKGKDPALDAEAMRLVSGFPRFMPATFDLVPVDRWLALPIKFNKADYDERRSKRSLACQSDNSDDYVGNEDVCSNLSEYDSINIPIFIVDGVEMQNIDNILPDDIVKMEVIKDSKIKQIFRPRLGGIVLITTKSKKNLKRVIADYKKNVVLREQNRSPGEIRIL